MNQQIANSLYGILNSMPSRKVRAYLGACQENAKWDEVRVASKILRIRYKEGERI